MIPINPSVIIKFFISVLLGIILFLGFSSKLVVGSKVGGKMRTISPLYLVETESNLGKNKAIIDIIGKKYDKPYETYQEIEEYMGRFGQKIEYSDKPQYRTTVHIGQLKLLLSEIQFLTKYCGGNDGNNYLVVYAGSAPGNKDFLLADMFPNATFLLVDPNEHVIYRDVSHYELDDQSVVYFRAGKKSRGDNTRNNMVNLWVDGEITRVQRAQANDIHVDPDKLMAAIMENMDGEGKTRIYIYEDLMTNELAKAISKYDNVLFISDIRTSGGTTEFEEYPDAADVLHNAAMQYNWVKLMDKACVACMLKFRCCYDVPSDNDKLSEVQKKDIELASQLSGGKVQLGLENAMMMPYLKPTSIYLQAFAGQSSTESRFVYETNQMEEIIVFDAAKYNNTFYFYNSIVRPYRCHNNLGDDTDPNYTSLSLDCCADCALMVQILEEYLAKNSKKEETVFSYIQKIMKVINKSVLASLDCTDNEASPCLHGMLTQPYSNVSHIIDSHKKFAKILFFREHIKQIRQYKIPREVYE